MKKYLIYIINIETLDEINMLKTILISCDRISYSLLKQLQEWEQKTNYFIFKY